MSKKTKDKKPVPTEVESTPVQPETQDVIKGRLTEEEWWAKWELAPLVVVDKIIYLLEGSSFDFEGDNGMVVGKWMKNANLKKTIFKLLTECLRTYILIFSI